MIPKKQRLSDEELKELKELYDSVKEKTLIRINCVIAWGKGWEWSTIEDIFKAMEILEKYSVVFLL
ncbi:MAG: hypothetical protein M1542_06925 [Thermotogae bacterium]|jgi:hypothetical protein|nr:hypothetical protein [Thermotogota bacterium]